MKIEFKYPANLYGIYDTGSMVIYIFGATLTEDEIIEVLNHEMIHLILQKLEGKKASLTLDNVDKKLLQL